LKSFCISHVKDVDGVGAAALVMAAKGARPILSDYDTLIQDLGRVPKNADELVICDLGTDDTTRGEFVGKLKEIAKRTRVTYIDHHYLGKKEEREIRSSGVELVHDESECASMLAYLTFKEELPREAMDIALYGAVTDYMDGSPNAKRLMEMTDRQFILAEATLLSMALSNKEAGPGFPQKIASALSKMKQPHEIDDVVGLAVDQLAAMQELAKVAKEHGRKMGRLAYMDTTQRATGNVAKLLIGAFDVPVGVSMRRKGDWYEVSLRGTSGCRVHLGQTAGKVAKSLGGSGGGHALAAGCRVPVEKMPALLERLSELV